MSSTTSVIKNIQPHDVTAWTYDIEMQMLHEEILKLKKNLTETTTKQIEEKEKNIAEKKIALEKHCRHFGMAYGKYGTGESEVKLEDTNNEETGALTNGHVEMDEDSAVEPGETIDAAASIAPDEIKSQSPAVNVYDSNRAIESIEEHQETSMAVSHDVTTGMGLDDPFNLPAGRNAPPNLFHPPTGTFHDDPFNTHERYASAFTANNPFVDQNTGSTNVDMDKYLDDQETNYTTSAGHVGDTSIHFAEDEMDMSTMADRDPLFEQAFVSDMEKHDDL